jgi:hypothetical protein
MSAWTKTSFFLFFLPIKKCNERRMLGGFALCDMLHENWIRLLSDFIHHREK